MNVRQIKSLKQLRKDSGLKAEKVAEVLGVSRRQLYNYEEKPSIISEDKLNKLCELYNIQKEEIMKYIKLGRWYYEFFNVWKRKKVTR